MLREHIEQHANEQKHRELKQNDAAAGQQRTAAVAFTFCRQQTLHDGLVRPVARHGEKCAPD